MSGYELARPLLFALEPETAHRVTLKPNAELRGLTAAKVVTQILEGEPVPPPSVVSRFGRRAAG